MSNGETNSKATITYDRCGAQIVKLDECDCGDCLTKFATGAVRSADVAAEAWELIPLEAMQALARTLHEGGRKYGDYNWEKGVPARDCLRHALRHIYMFLDGDRSEPHVAHALTNLAFAETSLQRWPELNRDLRPERPTPTSAGKGCAP